VGPVPALRSTTTTTAVDDGDARARHAHGDERVAATP
jgi:hypothetical protein